ncbi:hypothetical protein BO94DRAFT_547059 [Aspergillus sclerotioniger CBS 115572]|uniref:Uncharacterized protein n=1 Tax=Aspergillus sclerotioniger CBS 115572 TaxID=1450535 RepID=A0A317WIL0_9EURO|nr:hypothetical protein BO94DRAFT_547059 [Aspergillus sclerotioniger CBS 115572]PWY85885.1 hypothetical protein BO94DRAFT_547059 [Aspergillus sclerotioniger CBS 115572]
MAGAIGKKKDKWYDRWRVIKQEWCGEQGFPSAQPYLSHTPGGLFGFDRSTHHQNKTETSRPCMSRTPAIPRHARLSMIVFTRFYNQMTLELDSEEYTMVTLS